MNNAGFLAEDFQQIKTKSDDAVFELLKNKESEKTDEKPKAKQVVKPAEDLSRKRTERPPVSKPVNPIKTTKPKQTDSKEWGKPVTLFNTRIPQELSDLLDDLVYKSKKEGNPTTKQAIAIEALENYLRQEGMLRSAN